MPSPQDYARFSDTRLKQHALDGDRDAQWIFGLRRYKEGAPGWKEAREFFQYAADQGLGPAQKCVADMLANSQGGPRNIHLALAYYTKAAEQKIGSAQFQLGLYCSTGIVIHGDIVLQRGIDSNIAFLEGEVILNRDLGMAIQFFDQAYENGFKEAKKELFKLGSLLSTRTHLNPPLKPQERKALQERFKAGL